MTIRLSVYLPMMETRGENENANGAAVYAGLPVVIFITMDESIVALENIVHNLVLVQPFSLLVVFT